MDEDFRKLKVSTELKAVPRQFQKCFQQWQHRSAKYKAV
jgi:hypothetical protein